MSAAGVGVRELQESDISRMFARPGVCILSGIEFPAVFYSGRGMAFGPSSGFDSRAGCVLAPDASWIALDRWNELSEDEQSDFAPI